MLVAFVDDFLEELLETLVLGEYFGVLLLQLPGPHFDS